MFWVQLINNQNQLKLDLNQITIQVKNVELSVVFYEKLGLKLIVKAFPKYARFECTKGNTTFSLHQSDEIQNNSTWLYFESDSLDEDVTRLQNLGLIFEILPENQPWLWREARLRDLDNNIIILYFAGSNRKNPPWRIMEVK